MVDIVNFMDAKFSEINDIISSLPDQFSSHDFIEKFSRRNEDKYIEWLLEYKGTNHAFQSVNGQIARYLSVKVNDGTFALRKLPKGLSEHIFGEIDYIQWWEKK